jgi:hypothetical protein
VASLLYDCWDQLGIDDHTNMRADKLWRIEEPTWRPPILQFKIERHGATVNGSSRAEVHISSIDLDKGTAGIAEERRRQLGAMDARLDIKPIAESLAKAIMNGEADKRLTINRDGSVRLNIGLIIPAMNKQTTGARRSRVRKHLDSLLIAQGWKPVRTNVYSRLAFYIN